MKELLREIQGELLDYLNDLACDGFEEDADRVSNLVDRIGAEIERRS